MISHPAATVYKAFNKLPACILLFILVSCNGNKNKAQNTNPTVDTLQKILGLNQYPVSDQSPMDMCYFPRDYPILKMNGSADTFGLVARVIYSRPQKKDRAIFGSNPGTLCQYGKEWRLGANEATEIEFYKPVVINKKEILPGRYIIYCIPYADKWTIVFNSNLYTWGLHMEKSKDIFRTDIPIEQQIPSLEDFTMVFEKASHGTNLVMAWDDVKATLPIGITL